VTIYDDKGVPADAKATFFEVDGALFIDIFPREGRLKEDLVQEREPVHLLSRVKIKGPDEMSFNALDYEWLAREVQTGAIQLPYERIPQTESDIIFTASSDQWVDFLRQHKDDSKAFPEEGEAGMIRKEPGK
jgi:hypothetical protein